MLGKSGLECTSELSLETQVKSKDSVGKKVDWKVSLIPENEKQPLLPLYS